MAYLDYTSFAQAGTFDGTAVVAADSITLSSFARNANAVLSRDFGAGYFAGYERHLLKLNVASYINDGTNNDIIALWALDNGVYTIAQAGTAATGIAVNVQKTASAWRLRIINYAASTADPSVDLSNDTDYYLDISRRLTAGEVIIRTGSHAGSIVDALSLTVPSTAYRYYTALRPRAGAESAPVITGGISEPVIVPNPACIRRLRGAA